MRALALIFGLLAAPAALAATCEDVTFEGARFTSCEVDLTTEDLRLFLRGPDGAILGSFTRAEEALAPGQRLGVAMNGGMFHDDRAPVGLYIEDAQQEMRVITSAGPGNFGLLPNGVFCINDGRAQVIESRSYAADSPPCRYATQSGPMLVIDGALHPRFLRDGTSTNIRNGVGVDTSGQHAYLVISNDAVNFHLFARFFRDYLRVPNALYLDGRVSRMHAPQLGRSDYGFPLGPILGTVVDAPGQGE